ncbi:MAG: gamma-glutamyltransferase [Cohaesibacteraceae bacterium]
MRDFQAPGRSPARGNHMMAATSHPAATTAALQTMGDGGNAVDAALAASAVLSVVEPHMTGLGGDCFAIVAQPDGTLHGGNGSGRSPAMLDAQMLRDEGHAKVPYTHVHSITVPGALRGFEYLASHYGTTRFRTLLEPAIKLARDGWIVGDRVAYDWAKPEFAGQVEADPVLARVFRPKGHVPVAGDRIVWPQLAETLQVIQQNGADAFYTGEIAQDIVAHVRERGGVMSLSDMAACQADKVMPLTADYRGLTIAELPPNGQGVVALIALKILERFDLATLDPFGPERHHLELEACRAAYTVRDAFVGDFDTTVDAAKLYDEAAIDALAAQIDPAKRNASFVLPEVPDSDTIYLSTADSEGRMVSLIYSVYGDFGAMTATEKTGIVLQNRGACFSLREGHANEMKGGKRPMHTIIPAMALQGGKPVMSFGVMGGAYQPSGHAHFITNMVDYGMDPQAALDAPRVFWDVKSNEPIVERAFGDDVLEGLRAKGHPAKPAVHPIGGGQAIWRDPQTGSMVAGSDPRKDGGAAGL